MFMIFRKKTKKEEIIEIINELIQILKEEGMISRNIEGSLATSSTNYFEEKEEEESSTLVVSFGKTISVDERSSKDLYSDNGETS